jgi:hypothetical protein
MKENNQGKEILKLIQDNYYIIDYEIDIDKLRKLQEIIGV